MGEKSQLCRARNRAVLAKGPVRLEEMRPERERESQSQIFGSYRLGKEPDFHLGSHWKVTSRKGCDWIYAKNKQTITVFA